MASLNEKTTPLDLRLAKHLARRTCYATSQTFVNSLVGLTPAQAMTLLFADNAPTMDQPIDPATGNPWINSAEEPMSDDFLLRHYVMVWWMHEAFNDSTIKSKLMFFLHQSFTVHAESGYPSEFFDYLAYLRHYAYGSLKDLAKKITVDNTMLSYLDGAYSWTDSPNENYGREFLELFSIGKGPQLGPGDYTWYTEYDIQQAARVLTGWVYGERDIDLDPDTGLPMGRPRNENWAHDNGDKVFSSKFGGATITGQNTTTGMVQEISDFVDMVFNQTETARNFCRKLYRYFVSGKITTEIETDIIIPLAATLISNNYNIVPTLQQLLTSQHFYDEDDASATDEIIGAIVKSPLDNVLHTMSLLNISTPDPIADSTNHYENFWRMSVKNVILEKADMDIFQPSNVAGYPAYYDEILAHRAWFNSSTIIARYKIPEMLLTGDSILSWHDLGGVIFNPVSFVENSVGDPSSATNMVSELAQMLFSEMPSPGRLNSFFVPQLLGNMDEMAWTDAWSDYKNSGDESMVKPALDSLFTALLYSQEYQVM